MESERRPEGMEENERRPEATTSNEATLLLSPSLLSPAIENENERTDEACAE